MRKARFSEDQITSALKQVESGKPVGEVCRQIGVRERAPLVPVILLYAVGMSQGGPPGEG